MANWVDGGVEWVGSSRLIVPEADVLLGIFLDTAGADAVLRVMRDHERNQTIFEGLVSINGVGVSTFFF